MVVVFFSQDQPMVGFLLGGLEQKNASQKFKTRLEKVFGFFSVTVQGDCKVLGQDFTYSSQLLDSQPRDTKVGRSVHLPKGFQLIP